MKRADLIASTSPTAVLSGLSAADASRHISPLRGLIDETGAPIPSARQPVEVDVRTLPLIEADALPPLPRGIEARLYQDPDGQNHTIVLWSPVHEVAVDFPLVDLIEDRGAIVTAAAAMVAAFPTSREQRAFGTTRAA